MQALVWSMAAWTTLLGYFVMRRSLTTAGIRAAVLWMLDGFGMAIVFLAANVVSGMVGILVLRSFGFVSLYMLGDMSIVMLSLVQGLFFQCWRAQPGRRDAAPDDARR